MPNSGITWVSIYEKDGSRSYYKGMSASNLKSFCSKLGIKFEEGRDKATDSQGRTVRISNIYEQGVFTASPKGDFRTR